MTIRGRIALSLLLLLGGVLAACQGTPPALAGRTFLSIGVSENGAPKALVPGTQIRLDFKEGALSGNAGCNTFGGEYRLDGGRLILGVLTTTAMDCDAARMAQDTWLMTALGAGPQVVLLGDQLTIDSGSVGLVLGDRRVVEPDLAISGPTWTVDTIFSGETASSVPDGVVATLVFQADGTLVVDTSCNAGRGRWQTVGGGIEVRDIALTKKGCIGPSGELERAVMGVLNAGTLVAAIDADQLILRAGGSGSGLGLRGR